jgi:hypothetical protein
MAQTIHFHSRAAKSKSEHEVAPANPRPPVATGRHRWRFVAYAIGAVVLLVIALVELARAGGPAYVAGVCYFNIVLGSSQAIPVSDANGLASLAPSTGGVARPLEIDIIATAGTAAPLQYELSVIPARAQAWRAGEIERSRMPGETMRWIHEGAAGGHSYRIRRKAKDSSSVAPLSRCWRVIA